MSVGSTCPLIPASDLHFVKGSPLAIGDGAGVTVVEMWATWCPPCRASIPHLTEIVRKLKPHGVNIVGVTTETDVPKIERFVQSMGDKMDYTVALDVRGSVNKGLYEKSDAGGIPHAFVIGADNRIAWAGHPMDAKFESAIVTAVQAAKAAPPKQTYPPVTMTAEELSALPVKQLRKLLEERGVSFADCIEKGDLVKRILERCTNVTYER